MPPGSGRNGAGDAAVLKMNAGQMRVCGANGRRPPHGAAAGVHRVALKVEDQRWKAGLCVWRPARATPKPDKTWAEEYEDRMKKNRT